MEDDLTAIEGPEHGIPNSLAALSAAGLLFSGLPEAKARKKTATLIASVALWSLRERRDVEFSSWDHELLWWSWRDLMVLVVSDESDSYEIQSDIPFRPSRFSLEQELLNQARSMSADRHKGPDSRVRVRDVIEQWFARDYGDPHRELIDQVTDQAKTAGLYEQISLARRNPISRFLLGPKDVSIPTLARASELAGAGQTLAAKWQQFEQLESDFSMWLMKTVADAIARRTISSD